MPCEWKYLVMQNGQVQFATSTNENGSHLACYLIGIELAQSLVQSWPQSFRSILMVKIVPLIDIQITSAQLNHKQNNGTVCCCKIKYVQQIIRDTSNSNRITNHNVQGIPKLFVIRHFRTVHRFILPRYEMLIDFKLCAID